MLFIHLYVKLNLESLPFPIHMTYDAIKIFQLVICHCEK
jgi:hypothetical protein